MSSPAAPAGGSELELDLYVIMSAVTGGADEAEYPGEYPVVEAPIFRQVMGHFASGVTVVTGMADEVPLGFTCQAFASVSLEPPLVLISPSKSSVSWPRIQPSGRFSVNALAEAQGAIGRRFAVSGGDKFSGVRWDKGPTGDPILEGVVAWVACRIERILEVGDHYLVIGEVIDLAAGQGNPLLFYRGGFAGVVSGSDSG